jgi:hypothetical protein
MNLLGFEPRTPASLRFFPLRDAILMNRNHIRAVL